MKQSMITILTQGKCEALTSSNPGFVNHHNYGEQHICEVHLTTCKN